MGCVVLSGLEMSWERASQGCLGTAQGGQEHPKDGQALLQAPAACYSMLATFTKMAFSAFMSPSPKKTLLIINPSPALHKSHLTVLRGSWGRRTAKGEPQPFPTTPNPARPGPSLSSSPPPHYFCQFSCTENPFGCLL